MLNKSIELHLCNTYATKLYNTLATHVAITVLSQCNKKSSPISNSCFLHQVSLPARLQWQELFDQHRRVFDSHLPERGGVQGRHQQLQVCVSLWLHGALLWDRTLCPAPLPPGQRVWAPRLSERGRLLPAQLNGRLRLQVSPWWVNVESDLTPNSRQNQTAQGHCSLLIIRHKFRPY